MNKDFDNIDSLIEEVIRDQRAEGADCSMLNRYPVRFVLFDNFVDSKVFVKKLIDSGVNKMHKIVDWMNKAQPDQMMTYSNLADCIKQYVECNSLSSSIIVPFSELSRFYDNNSSKEFDALLCDIKGIQTTKEGYLHHQRIYIPMIGQYGKMSKFFSDPQSIIWHLIGSRQEKGYRVILTRSTYNLNGLENDFTIVPTITDWLKMWRDDTVKSDIISTSKSIYALAENAQPDNALTYAVCHNAYEFLTKGINLNFGELNYRKEDALNWEKLASEIEYKSFSFEKFFNKYFDIFDLTDYTIFLKIWFENTEHFKRWLLTIYYAKRFNDSGYICRLICNSHSYTTLELVSSAVLSIFEIENPEKYLEERAAILDFAKKHGVKLSDDVEYKLHSRLENIAQEKGYETALRYLTGLSDGERQLMIIWVSQGHIALNRLSELYPELYSYMDKNYGKNNIAAKWVLEYIDAYKQAKLANTYTNTIQDLLKKCNANAITFNSWYNQFRTVRTELCERNDIDVYYWIDGLGIDWIPFILREVEKYNGEDIFANDVKIARSLLPSKTSNNKEDLMKLTKGELAKKGDIDGFAHKCTPYPQYIIEEIKLVQTALKEILTEHAGKKIAIVSDHGLSYLSQLRPWYNIGGIKSDHNGRCAVRQIGVATQDDKYIILEDGQTLCALHHESLAAKIPEGQGCHGGCTPEEVLVPIIIISSQRQSSEYIISLSDNEVAGNNPILTFKINGLNGLEVPKLVYNNMEYNLNKKDKNVFESDRISFKNELDEVEVHVGNYIQRFKIKINFGAEEVDIFDL